MMTQRIIIATILSIVFSTSLHADSGVMTYQGRVQSGGSDFTGTGQFKFALVDAGYVKIGSTRLSGHWQFHAEGTRPAARRHHKAVWTGSAMIVWGGTGGTYLNDTWSYFPSKLMFLYQKL